jgi:hypothetical protein
VKKSIEEPQIYAKEKKTMCSSLSTISKKPHLSKYMRCQIYSFSDPLFLLNKISKLSKYERAMLIDRVLKAIIDIKVPMKLFTEKYFEYQKESIH